MKKSFKYQFEDKSKKNSISFEYSKANNEKLDVVIENGVPVMYGNKTAYLALAKFFIQLGTCEYIDGFHTHIAKDFLEESENNPEILRVGINDFKS